MGEHKIVYKVHYYDEETGLDMQSDPIYTIGDLVEFYNNKPTYGSNFRLVKETTTYETVQMINF